MKSHSDSTYRKLSCKMKMSILNATTVKHHQRDFVIFYIYIDHMYDIVVIIHV